MRGRSRILAACSATVCLVALTAAAQASGDVVAFTGYAAGTIVVKTNERRLYLVVDAQHAISYPVGVGRSGKQWQGTSRIDGKYVRPAWSPPAEVRRDKPSLPDVIPGGTPQNPMGVAALTLAGTEYAIHGTNRPGSIRGFVSYASIPMYTHSLPHLFARATLP